MAITAFVTDKSIYSRWQSSGLGIFLYPWTVLFIKKNHPPSYRSPAYKKLQPLISAFIKNSFFGNNRDPSKGRPQEKNTELFGNFSQHGGGGGLLNPKTFVILP